METFVFFCGALNVSFCILWRSFVGCQGFQPLKGEAYLHSKMFNLRTSPLVPRRQLVGRFRVVFVQTGSATKGANYTIGC